MRPTSLRFSSILLLLCILTSSAVYGQTGGPEEIGCPVVFDLVPFADDDDDGNDGQGRGLQLPPCPTLCQFTGPGPGAETFHCDIPVLNDNVNPFIIEISHPQLEETLTLLVAPHPTYAGRLLVSFPESTSFVLQPEMCSGNLFIYSSSGIRLEIMINFDLEHMLMTVVLPGGVTFRTRLQNCGPDEVDPEVVSSLRGFPGTSTEISASENRKAGHSQRNKPAFDHIAANRGMLNFTNPVAEELVLRFAEALKEDPEIVIFSMQGRLMERRPAPGNTTEFSVPVSHLTPGAYCLRVQYRNGAAPETHIFIKR